MALHQENYWMGQIGRILLDTGATKSYMSKSFYMQCKCLHALPKFSSHTRRIQVGNGQYVGVFFVIPVIINIHMETDYWESKMYLN